MIKVTGNNQLCQLDPKVASSHDLNLKVSSLSSFSVYAFHSVWVENSGYAYGLGDNRKGQISNTLGKELFIKPVKIPLPNVISAVCCTGFTIYMTNSGPSKGNKQLVFLNSQKSKTPVILNIDSKQPVSLFGGNKTAAAIDSNGGVIVITESMLEKEIFTPIKADLPDNAKASYIACGDKLIIVLANNGKLYKSSISYSNTLSRFYQIPELKDKKFTSVAGTSDHFIAVTEDGNCYVQGSNNYCKIGLRQNMTSSDKFVQVHDLSNIKAAFTGELQSFFLNKDGALLGCGCSMNDQLFMTTGKKIPQISSPAPTSFSKGVTFAIGGDDVSVAFVNCNPPPNTPNMIKLSDINSSPSSKEITVSPSSNSKIVPKVTSTESNEPSSSKEVAELQKKLITQKEAYEKQVSDLNNQLNTQKAAIEKARELEKQVSDLKSKLSTQKETLEKQQKQKILELETQLSSKTKRITELEKRSSAGNSNLSFDPFEKDQKEATDPNYYIGQESEEYLKVIRKIGEGATSITFKVFDSRTQQMMCKKVLKTGSKTTFKNLQDAMKEFDILHSIYHPCICRAIGINTQEVVNTENEEEEINELEDDESPKEKTTVALYLEFLSHGLKECLTKKLMDNTLKARIVIEVAHAMNYIHKRGLIHRDLKIENIMMNSVFEAKIVDFGLAKIDECFNQSENDQSFTRGVGTLAYMSPEMVSEKDYDNKTDVYSFGIVLFYMFTGNLPRYNMEDRMHGRPLPLPKPSMSISQFCLDLITKCCKHEPADRPSFEQIIKEIRDNSYVLASNIDLAIVSKRDRELDFFESKYK